MKIGIDVRLLSRGSYSGVEEYTKHLVSNLISQNSTHQLKFFYSGLKNQPLPIRWLSDTRTDLVDWPLPNKLINPYLAVSNLVKPNKLLGVDAVLSPHLNYFPAVANRLLIIHDLSFLHYPHFFSSSQRLWHRFQNVKKQITNASHIVTDSEFTKGDIIQLCNLPADKISVIPPGLSDEFKTLDSFSPDLQKFKEQYQLQNPFLLYVGSLEPRKNVPALISAFNLLKSTNNFPQIKLVLVSGKGWLTKNILTQIKDSPFTSDIKIIHNLIPSQRVLLYNLASVFVYPSFFEGFGFPPLEAQACGVPVVASNRTSLPEVLANSALLVNPWRITDLADAITSVLTNKDVTNQLIKAGFTNIKRFSWPDTAKQVLKIITNFPL